jgi:hypothetical protein
MFPVSALLPVVLTGSRVRLDGVIYIARVEHRYNSWLGENLTHVTLTPEPGPTALDARMSPFTLTLDEFYATPGIEVLS